MMVILKIMALCTMCSFLSSVNTLPVIVLESSNELVPVPSHYRLVRDVFPDTTDSKPTHVSTPSSGTNKDETTTSDSAVTDVATGKKEILKPVSEDSTALFKLLHRFRRSHNRYADNDDYYEDRDYAGYDKKGSEVGYMDDKDDFPTVVW